MNFKNYFSKNQWAFLSYSFLHLLGVMKPTRAGHTLSAQTHHMNVDYSAYEGWAVTGKVKTVLLRGKVAIADGECKVGKGNGEFIKRGKVTGII